MVSGFPDSKKPKDSFEEALERYSRERDKNPLDLGVHIKIADLYLVNGHREKALDEYESAVRVYKKNALTQLVISTYRQILSIAPDHFNTYRELADFYLDHGFQEDAVAVLLELARQYQSSSMERETSSVIEEIAAIVPDNVSVKQKLAAIYEENLQIKQKKKNAAAPPLPAAAPQPVKQDLKLEDIETIESQLKSEPSIVLSEFNEPPEPEPTSEPLINISEFGEEAEMLDLSGAENSLDKVQQEIELLIDRDFSDPPEAHYRKGLELQRDKKYAQAMDSYLTALDGLGNRADCYARLAECCLALNKISTAEKFISEGLSLTPLSQTEKLNLKFHLARIMKARGQGQQAKKVIDEIRKTDKDFTPQVNEDDEVNF